MSELRLGQGFIPTHGEATERAKEAQWGTLGRLWGRASRALPGGKMRGLIAGGEEALEGVTRSNRFHAGRRAGLVGGQGGSQSANIARSVVPGGGGAHIFDPRAAGYATENMAHNLNISPALARTELASAAGYGGRRAMRTEMGVGRASLRQGAPFTPPPAASTVGTPLTPSRAGGAIPPAAPTPPAPAPPTPQGGAGLPGDAAERSVAGLDDAATRRTRGTGGTEGAPGAAEEPARRGFWKNPYVKWGLPAVGIGGAYYYGAGDSDRRAQQQMEQWLLNSGYLQQPYGYGR